MVLATVASAQTITFTPSTFRILNPGDTLVLSADVEPAGEYTYQWVLGNRPPGVTTTGDNTSELTIMVADDNPNNRDLEITLEVRSAAGRTSQLEMDMSYGMNGLSRSAQLTPFAKLALADGVARRLSA